MFLKQTFKLSIFSSLELMAQVSFTDRNLSVVCCLLSIVIIVVNFSHFHLLQNHWANFKQTLHKASLSVGDSSLLNEVPCPFPSGDNYEIAKIH